MSEIKQLQDTIASMQQSNLLGRGIHKKANGYVDSPQLHGDDMEADMLDSLESSRPRGISREGVSISSLQSQVLKQVLFSSFAKLVFCLLNSLE